MNKRMYVIVRNDLTNGQKAVQGGHALAEYILNNKCLWKNETLIYLKAKDEDHIKDIMNTLKNKKVNHSCFYEPDLDNQITSIAFEGQNELTLDLRLL